jgi:hypothetical protein
MTGMRHTLRALTGFGLASALFVGCEFGQKPIDDTPSQANVNQDPSELALKLSVKDTGACLELKHQIELIKAGGEVDAELIAKFARECVVEIKDSKPVIIPPNDQIRCRWILSQIDGGRDELVVKFRYYCPDSCQSMVMDDSLQHDKVCREPKPEEKPSCEELKQRLAAMDTATEEYKRLRHFVAEICSEPHPDPIPVPKPPTCDELRRKLESAYGEDSVRLANELANHCPVPHPLPGPNCDSLRLLLNQADSGSAEYNRIYHMMAEHKCRLPEPVPQPDPGTWPDCDSLRMLLKQAAGDTGSEYYHRLQYMLLVKKCDMPQPVPGPSCDSLRILLKMYSTDSTKDQYARVYHMMLEKKCIVPDPIPNPGPNCDSLRILLKHAMTDSTKDEYARIYKLMLEKKCIVPDPVPVPNPGPGCDSLRHMLARADSGSETYNKILHMMAEKKCLVILPAPEPTPLPTVNCDELRKKLALLDPASADYAYIKEKLAANCPM